MGITVHKQPTNQPCRHTSERISRSALRKQARLKTDFFLPSEHSQQTDDAHTVRLRPHWALSDGVINR